MHAYTIVALAVVISFITSACSVMPEREEKLRPKALKIAGKNHRCFWSIHRWVDTQKKLTAYVCGTIGSTESHFNLYLVDKKSADVEIIIAKWNDIKSAAELPYVTDLGYRDTGTLFLHPKLPKYYLAVEQALQNMQLRVENDIKITRLF